MRLRKEKKYSRKGSTALQHKKTCKLKQRFKDKLDADSYALEYNNERVLMFTPVESYFCYKHSCWHIGHKYDTRRKVDTL